MALRYKKNKPKTRGFPSEFEKTNRGSEKRLKEMPGSKSRRYKQQMEKIRAKTQGVTNDNMGFSIRPGMSSWVDMPKKYKNEYYKWAKEVEKRREA
jgi:hypothetical protein